LNEYEIRDKISLLEKELEDQRSHVADCFERINKIKDDILDLSKILSRTAIESLKGDTALKDEIYSMAGKKGSSSGKKWGVIISIGSAIIIKVIETIFGG